jgi:Kdo2-lipid IVA lauroyltransferase/acyltransferase
MSTGLSELLQTVFPDIVGRASPRASRDLMLAAGSIYFALNTDERKRIEKSVGDLLGPGERAEATKRAVFGQILEHYFEKLLVANRSRAFVADFVHSRVRVGDLTALDRALEGGRGVIAVTTHWGAVELIPPILAERGYPLSVVLEAKTPRLRASLERLAVGRDAELIIASRGDRVLERILSALARGRVLVTQVDEVDAWRRRASRTIRLFGKSLYFDHSLDFIAKRAMAPAVGLACRREGGFRYDLSCELLAADPSSVDVAKASLGFWERRTLEAPEQWYQWTKWEAMKALA